VIEVEIKVTEEQPVANEVVPDVPIESHDRSGRHSGSKKVGSQRRQQHQDQKGKPLVKPEELNKQVEEKATNDDQWELVPTDIKENKFEEWETSVRGKKYRKGVRQFQVQYFPIHDNQKDTIVDQQTPTLETLEEKSNQNLSQDTINEKSQENTRQTKIEVHPDCPVTTEDIQESVESTKHTQKQLKQQTQRQQRFRPVEVKEDKNPAENKQTVSKPDKKLVDPEPSDLEDKQEEMSQTSERSASASSVQSVSVSVKKNRKKRSGGDENKSDRTASNFRQVLVHDGVLNFSDPGIAGARWLLKRPNDLINEQVSLQFTIILYLFIYLKCKTRPKTRHILCQLSGVSTCCQVYPPTFYLSCPCLRMVHPNTSANGANFGVNCHNTREGTLDFY